MAKVKNKRNSGLADKVQGKKKTEANKKKLNPFEVHINREKLKVLGKKSKHDKGLPGVSRAKAIQRRKETLGTEMKLMNKTNTFIDRRIGEKDRQLSAEDRMVARFAAERANQHSKKNIYNLADDELLTHRGQTLEQIEKFDDPRSDEEDEDGKGFGGLGDDFVAEGHFGGGMLSRAEADGAKSHKDLIEQLIAESKKRKAEKQKEKEQTLDLTEKLDTEWKDLQPVVLKRARVESESIIDKVLSNAEKKGEDYDKMMRELKFEKRGTPSDGLKSDEKQAKEERERLEQWERERRQRMTGEEPSPKVPSSKPNHRSAEDLDDNFELDDEKEFMLAYDKEGKPLVPEDVLKNFSVPNAKPKFEDGVSDTSSEDDDDADDSSNDDDANDESDDESDEQEDDKDNENDEQEDDKDNENDDDSSSDGTDEESDDEKELDSKVNEAALKKKDAVPKTKEATNKTKDTISKVNDVTSKITDIATEKNDLTSKLSTANKTKDKIGKINENKINDTHNGIGLFQRPENDGEESNDDSGDDSDETDDSDDQSEMIAKVDDFSDLKGSDAESDDEIAKDKEKIGSFFDNKTLEGDNLKELLSDKSPAQVTVALQKLIKSYDPSLAENNKDLLSRLFAHMLQYTNDIFTDVTDENTLNKAFLTFDRLIPHFYDLAKTNKVSTKKYLVELLKEKREIYMKNVKKIPDLDTLVFFKLVSLLYPTSDFRHPVTTPCLIFMSEILTNSRFNNAYSISRGLFLTALILEYTVLSKRLVPSAINFLRGVLFLSANTSILNPIQVVPPFRQHKDANILNLSSDCSKMNIVNKMCTSDLVLEDISEEFKIKCLLTSTLMTKEFFDNFNDIEAQECLFESHIKLLGRVELENYPKKVQNKVLDILKDMKDSLEVKTYTPLCREKKKPKALRLYEPDVQEVFTGSKSGKLSREQAERARLTTRYKREMKGALREIRRDRAYVANVKIRQKIHSDNIRKQKVKEIFKDASIQQSELNKLKRMK